MIHVDLGQGFMSASMWRRMTDADYAIQAGYAERPVRDRLLTASDSPLDISGCEMSCDPLHRKPLQIGGGHRAADWLRQFRLGNILPKSLVFWPSARPWRGQAVSNRVA